jgi:hypothetical protein
LVLKGKFQKDLYQVDFKVQAVQDSVQVALALKGLLVRVAQDSAQAALDLKDLAQQDLTHLEAQVV